LSGVKSATCVKSSIYLCAMMVSPRQESRLWVAACRRATATKICRRATKTCRRATRLLARWIYRQCERDL